MKSNKIKKFKDNGDEIEINTAPGIILSDPDTSGIENHEQFSPPSSCRNYYTECIITALMCCLTFIIKYGNSFTMLKLSVTAIALITASAQDIRTRSVPDFFTLIILCISAAGKENIQDIYLALLNCIVIYLPLAIIKHINFNKSIGGADIKLISACAAIHGVTKAAIILSLALGSALVLYSLKSKKQPQNCDISIPLVPYITFGFIAVSLLP